MLSPRTSASFGPRAARRSVHTSCTSELSKGCLHVASYDVLVENNSLGYHVGRDRGETSREAVTASIHPEWFSADRVLLRTDAKADDINEIST